MTRAMGPLLLPNPIQVLLNLAGANAREADPYKALVHWKQSAAPAQGFDAGTAHFVQIDHAFGLERPRIRDYDVPVDGGEIEGAVEEKAVVRPLNADFDLAAGVSETNGIALMKSRDPDFIPQLKNMVGMSAVRFGSRNLAVIGVPGKDVPGIFAHHVPVAQEFSVERDFGHDIEASDHDQQRAIQSRLHLMNIFEHRNGNINPKATR